jgi:hypothetical protein
MEQLKLKCIVSGSTNWFNWFNCFIKSSGNLKKISKHAFTLWPSNSTTRYLPKRNKKHISTKDYYLNVCNRFINNGPKPEAAKYLPNIIEGETVAYLCFVILSNNIKEKIFIYTKAWIDLEKFMLSERSLTQTHTHTHTHTCPHKFDHESIYLKLQRSKLNL